MLDLKKILTNWFTLDEDKADEALIVESIKRNVSFKGTNLWTLIFAIFIASVGLNVNSTAVIIGAMLISPLMGPIMGIGLGIAINDFELLKKGIKNLSIAASISIVTSALYFSITPLHDAGSELLARTNPSLLDVVIAFFGGLAGIVAGTRKEKSNVIPGVAIATALMPPLCTAGYGLASGSFSFFFGAFYLFFINSVFICLATFVIVKQLRFRKVEFESDDRRKRVSRYIFAITLLTALPSIYLTYRIVQKSIFEKNAQKFVQTELASGRWQVVTHNYQLDGKNPFIELLLIGQPLGDDKIDSLKAKLPQYGLVNVNLIIHQGLDAKQRIDISEIKASVVEAVFNREQHADSLGTDVHKNELPDLRPELSALYPSLRHFSLGTAYYSRTDTSGTDTLMTFIALFQPAIPKQEKVRLEAWLKQRLQVDTIKIITE